MFSWVHLLVLLAALIVIVLHVVFIVRRWRHTGINLDIALTLIGTAFFAAVSLLGAIFTLINLLTATQVQVTVPVQEYWPTAPDGVTVDTTGATAVRASGGFASADLWVEHIGAGARVLWAIGQTLGVLVPAAIAALIAVGCFQLLRGRAFAPVVARIALVAGVVVLVGGVLAQSLPEFGASIVSDELLSVSGATATGLAAGWDLTGLLPNASMSVTIPLWPIGAAFGFGALAAVLRYGAKLQRDTEGLV